MFDRRQTLQGLAGIGLLASCTRIEAAQTVTPEQFGAKGDGIAADGAAMAAMIEHLNALPGTERIEAYCGGDYLLAGVPERPAAPSHHEENGGRTNGLPAITRDNVTISASGARFTVPADFAFVRVVRGGSADDRFFVMWQFVGRGIRFVGGTVDGNLTSRPFRRGPRPIGFGGLDFGFVLEGEGWLLDGVEVANWGTDCALVTNSGRAVDCSFVRARRNGLSVVASEPIPTDRPVVIENCRFLDNGAWPEGVYNNPAAGIDVEAGGEEHEASVVVRSNLFEGNRLKDLQLARGAVDCLVVDNIFHNEVRLRPMQKGGHVIEHNRFDGGKGVLITSTGYNAKPVTIRDNTLDGAPQPASGFIRHSRSGVDGAGWEQDVIE